MRVINKHSRRIEIPNRTPAHHEQAERPKNAKVDRGIRLLHEARLLRLALDTRVDRTRPDEALHEELAREAQHNHIESDEREVAPAFAVLGRFHPVRRARVLLRGERVGAGEGVGEEDHVVDGV